MKLISFLGDTVYRKTTYRWQDREINTAYAAAACCEFFRPDELIVFCTEEAYSANWEGLCSAVREIDGPEPVYRNIAIGKNEAELWQIFGDLTETIPSGSEIAIDLTNGQRSLAAVVILASVFMKTGLNVNISHLYYGAFNVDKEMPGISPMFDLSPMLELVNWGIAAERFNRDGDARDLTKQFKEFGVKYAKEHEGEERVKGHTLRKLAESLDEISRCYLLLRPRQIHKAENRLDKTITEAKQSLGNIAEQRPLQLLLDQLQQTYLPQKQTYSNEGMEMLVRERNLIQWYREHGHYLHATALAREWLITWFMTLYGETSQNLLNDEDLRQYYENRLYEIKRWPKSGPFKNKEDKEKIAVLMKTLYDLRNDMMHAGKRENPAKPDNLLEQINEQINLLMQLPIPGEES